MNLNSKDQILLMKEIVYSSKLMKKLFKTSKLNVEKIGNIVPQLHIHIIARSTKIVHGHCLFGWLKVNLTQKSLLTKTIFKIKKHF